MVKIWNHYLVVPEVLTFKKRHGWAGADRAGSLVTSYSMFVHKTLSASLRP